MQHWTLEVGDLFGQLGMHTRGRVTMNENTYDFDPASPKDSWLYASLLGFQELKRQGFHANSFATIGTGSGMDSIGMYELFHPAAIYQTDIHPNVLEIADRNARTLIGKRCDLTTLSGNLCQPLLDREIRVDLLYANLPNVPSTAPIWDKKVSASQFVARDAENCPPLLRAWLLTLQYLFLKEARGVLAPGGVVVDAIGARVPYELLEQVFTVNGYTVSELASVYKIQSEPEDALPGYVRAEQAHGITFDFYDHERALPVWEKELAEKKLATPALKEALQPFHISAQKALALLEKHGKQAGHICSILKGIPVPTN